MSRAETHNFAAGPSPLPTDVLEEAAAGLLNYNNTGMGVCELSHRGKEFKAIIEGAETDIRKLLAVPDSYAVLFAQGGGTTQFSSVMLNLLAARRLKNPTSTTPPPIDYVVTGSWSSKAHGEAVRLSTLGEQVFAAPRIAATSKPNKFTALPTEYSFSKDAAYVYYCENETIHGAQFGNGVDFPFDQVPADVPIVADYSSSFLSRPIPNFERHAIVYAGAQKNLGPSGVTVVIVRKDLLVDTTEAMKLGGIPSVPIQSEYKTLADNGSLYNTPPVFPIYVSALVLKKLVAKGGLDAIRKVNEEKAAVLYTALEKAEKRGVAHIVVAPNSRSWMNVTFTVEDEAKFLKGAEERRFFQIKGHRSVGGIRASLYNAVSLDSVKALAAYIDEYQV